MLGVSVSTVRRRMWVALERLDAYVSRTRTWLSAIILLGVGQVIVRAHRLDRLAHTDWTQKGASTLALGAGAGAAVGLAAVTPDSDGPPRLATSPRSPVAAGAPGLALPEAPPPASDLDLPQKAGPPATDQ